MENYSQTSKQLKENKKKNKLYHEIDVFRVRVEILLQVLDYTENVCDFCCCCK